MSAYPPVRPGGGSVVGVRSSPAAASFQFSADIERDLAELEAGAGGDDATPIATPASPYTRIGGRAGPPLPPLHTHANDARLRASANPAAYAESFSRPPSQPGSASAPGRKLSIDADRLATGSATNSTPGSSSSSTPYSSHRFLMTPGNPSPRTIGAHFSAASLSGTPAPEHNQFYADDANYFNLGGSSFPLLPHNSLYESELHATPGSVGGIGPERAFSPSGRVHAQHFTSILNMPVAPSFVRENATRAAAGASAYLPSLASVWTFATGIAPPETISRASEGFVAFAEESVVDPGEFVLPPRAGLDEKDIDMTVVLQYVQRMRSAMGQYARNHPHSTLAAKFAREEQRRLAGRNKGGRGGHRKLRRASLAEGEEEDADDSAEGEYVEHEFPSSPFLQSSGTPAPSASPSSHRGVESAEDAAASLQLARDLNDCYAAIPPVYFQPAYSLTDQDFWRDEKDLAFLVDESVTRGLRSMHGGLDGSFESGRSGATTPGGTATNPYDSFTALSSYHASPHFHLPSLDEKKALQLRAYKLGEERRKRVHERGEHILQMQSVLSAHLDLVEQNLQQQIALKSWIFFDALKNVNAIQGEIQECLAGIADIRGFVRQLKETLSLAGLSVMQQLRTQENTRKLIRTLELTATVLKTSPTVQMLLASGDFTSALQLIQSTRVVIATELKGLDCVRHVETKLDEHARLIRQLMALEFCGLAIRGGNFYLSEVNTSVLTATGGEKTLVAALSPELVSAATGIDAAVSSSSSKSAAQATASSKRSHLLLASRRTLTEDEEDRLVPLVSGLLEIGEMKVVFEQYIEQLQGIMKQRLMDLVYELLNEVTKESEATENKKAAENATGRQNGDKGEHEDESESEEEVVNSEASAAAASLLSDVQPSLPAEEKTEAPPAPAPSGTSEVVSAALADVSQSDPATPPADGAPPAAVPSTSAAPPAAPRPNERRQAAIAMPIGAAPTTAAAANVTVAASPTAATAATPAPAPAASVPTPAASPPPGPSGISARFSSLQHEQFLALLQPMFHSLMDLIQRASTIRHLIVTCAQANATAAGVAREPAAGKELAQQLNDMLGVLVEYVHVKVSKILSTRSGVHASLSLQQFRGFLDAVLKFIQEGETLSGKTFYNLRSTLLLQAKAFLVVFHARCVQTLGAALENEKWVRVDVPSEYQQLLDSHFAPKKIEPTVVVATTPTAAAPVVDPFADPTHPKGHPTTSSSGSSSASSASALAKPASTWQNKSWNETAEEGADGPEGSAPPATSPAMKQSDSLTKAAAVGPTAPPSDVKRVLFVARPVSKGGAMAGGFMKFPVVHSLFVLLQIIGQYIECSSQLQAVGSDILNRLVELLQMFNSRSCQLVLGAGAMHLSGLKSITATHLALASQSVGLLVTQIPVLRGLLASRLPAKHHVLLVAFDRVAKDCQEHQREIFGKLTAIMGELIRGMVEKLDQLPWTKLESVGAGATGPATATLDEGDRVDEPVKTLMKQTCSLHRALSDLLLVEQRDAIFVDISSLFVAALRDFHSELDTKNAHVRMKVAYNLHHITTRLRTCTGVDEANIQKLTQMASL